MKIEIWLHGESKPFLREFEHFTELMDLLENMGKDRLERVVIVDFAPLTPAQQLFNLVKSLDNTD